MSISNDFKEYQNRKKELEKTLEKYKAESFKSNLLSYFFETLLDDHRAVNTIELCVGDAGEFADRQKVEVQQAGVKLALKELHDMGFECEFVFYGHNDFKITVNLK